MWCWAPFPAFPKSICTIPFLHTKTARTFSARSISPRRAKLDPFVLVMEGSIPNEKVHHDKDGYWAALGTDTTTGQPIKTTEWIDRLAPKAVAVVAIGTCATYGGIHAMQGNPTGCMGMADYLGWDWRSKAGLPHRQCSRMSCANRTTSWRQSCTFCTRWPGWLR